MRVLTLTFAALLLGCGAGPAGGIAAAAPGTCAELRGFVDAGRSCQIHATDPNYALNITYPTDFPDAAAVFDYVAQTRDGFLNVARMPGLHDRPYELDTTAVAYSSSIPPRSTQTVVFKTFQDVGGAHPQTYYKAFSWDGTQRKPITIDTLFREGTQPFSTILPMVQSELDKQSGQPAPIGPDVGLDPKTYSNFALTDDALIFFFGQGELLPESYGAPQVSVPRGPIDALIA